MTAINRLQRSPERKPGVSKQLFQFALWLHQHIYTLGPRPHTNAVSWDFIVNCGRISSLHILSLSRSLSLSGSVMIRGRPIIGLADYRRRY